MMSVTLVISATFDVRTPPTSEYRILKKKKNK